MLIFTHTQRKFDKSIKLTIRPVEANYLKKQLNIVCV